MVTATVITVMSGQAERVQHVGRVRCLDDRDAGLERVPDDPDQRQQQEHGDVDTLRSRPAITRPRRAAVAALVPGRGTAVAATALTASSSASGEPASVTSTSTNAEPNSSAATAAASAGRNWLASWKMNTGAVRVLPGGSPRPARRCRTRPGTGRTSAACRRTAGRIAGNTTRVERGPGVRAEGGGRPPPRPGRAPASTGCDRPNDERQGDDREREQDRDLRVDDLDAKVAEPPPIARVGAVQRASISPVTSVGIASGRSTSDDSTRRPGKRNPHQHVGERVPITPLITAAIVEVNSVRRIASHATGSRTARGGARAPPRSPPGITATGQDDDQTR